MSPILDLFTQYDDARKLDGYSNNEVASAIKRQIINYKSNEIIALKRDLESVLNTLEKGPELNTSNYDHDQVCELNAHNIEAYTVLKSIVDKLG